MKQAVLACDPRTLRLHTFRSTMDAERAGFNRRHIWSVVNGQQVTHRGMLWAYYGLPWQPQSRTKGLGRVLTRISL